MILGTPFLTLLYPFQVTKKGLITQTNRLPLLPLFVVCNFYEDK